MRVTADKVGRKTVEGAWDFQWGEVPAHVPDTTPLQQKAAALGVDITVEGLSNSEALGLKVGLSARIT